MVELSAFKTLRALRSLIVWSLLFLLTIVLVMKLLLWFPEPYFRYRTDYRNFRIYSTNSLPAEYTRVFDAIAEKITRCAHYDPGYRQRIFFSPRGTFYNFVMSPENQYYAYNSTFRHNVLIFQVADLEQNTVTHPMTGIAYPLDQVITHELTHTFVREDLPSWKKEGYAEYIANYREGHVASGALRQNALTLLASDTEEYRLVNEQGISRPRPYFSARVLAEYLFLVKGLTFEEFIGDKVREDETLAEVQAWARVP